LARIRGRIEAAEDPIRVFAEDYDQGDADTQDALRTVWEAKFANRGEDPGMADRRFDQCLSLGRRSLPRRTNRAMRESHELAAGVDTKIQFLLKMPTSAKLPEWLWVTVYKVRVNLLTQVARDLATTNPTVALLAPMVYIRHRRDSAIVRNPFRVSDGARRARSANGLIELARVMLGASLRHGNDFRFNEIYTEEVLGRVDHCHGLESSNAIDASVREDLVRLSVVKDFISGARPRPFNAKIGNSLLGVTNISGLLGAHNKPVGQLDVPALMEKLAKARKVLIPKRGEYLRKFIR
jgi:hypothetical protein